jgi:hypothetical protein
LLVDIDEIEPYPVPVEKLAGVGKYQGGSGSEPPTDAEVVDDETEPCCAGSQSARWTKTAYTKTKARDRDLSSPDSKAG